MKKITLTLTLLIGIFIFSFAQETDDRSLSSFSKIKSTASIDIVLEQGNKHHARIEAKGVTPDKILTDVQGETLMISMKKGNYNNIRVVVYITFKDLEALTLTGSGDIDSKGKIEADDINVTLHGSGDINIDDLTANSVELKLHGSGDVRVSGAVPTQAIRLFGSGDINTSGLKGSETTVHIAGSGDAVVHAKDKLNARVSGSGDIRFSGNPSLKEIKTSGSGSIKSM